MLLAAMYYAVRRTLPICAAAVLLLHIAVLLLPADAAAAPNIPSHHRLDDGCYLKFSVAPPSPLHFLEAVVGTKLCNGEEVETKPMFVRAGQLFWGAERIDKSIADLQKDLRVVIFQSGTADDMQIVEVWKRWHIVLGNHFYIEFLRTSNELVGCVQQKDADEVGTLWHKLGHGRVVNVNGDIFVGRLKLGIGMDRLKEILGVNLEQELYSVSRELVDQIPCESVELRTKPAVQESKKAAEAAVHQWPIEEILAKKRPEYSKTPQVPFSLPKVSAEDLSRVREYKF